MVKLKCATPILAGVVTVLRQPSFFILEKWVLSTESKTWSQLPLKAYGKWFIFFKLSNHEHYIKNDYSKRIKNYYHYQHTIIVLSRMSQYSKIEKKKTI